MTTSLQHKGISTTHHALVVLLLTSVAFAQTTPQSPASSSQQPAQSEDELRKKEQSQRILGIVPMFGVTNRQNAAPLTPRQKFQLVLRQQVDPFQWIAIGMQAGISQATNSFPEYGQGAEGYGKRYGAAFADGASSGFFSNFFFPVLLKHDPRYFRSGQGAMKRRIAYSLKQEFVCRTDRGGHAFNWSNVLGAVTAGGISNAYYPPGDRGFGLTMSRAAIALGYGAAGGLLEEFWPDIARKLFRRNKH